MTSPSADRRFGTSSGVAFKAPCRAATTANITLSGEQTVDGVALVTGDRCLVRTQTSGVDNGIYKVDTGAWTRDIDFDGERDAVTGTRIGITSGAIYANYTAILTTTGTITIGITSLAFTMQLPGTGTVTSVGFTGGIVSIANPTTTPVFTISGTSGGIPYFSSTSAWASSGLLTANTLILGGGAGAAPTSLAAGTSTTVLHGNAAGPPIFGAVSLTADVSGILPSANGGTGVNNASTITLGGNLTTSGAFATTITTTATTNAILPAGTNNIGYLEIPQNSKSAAYTTVLADSGKHIYHPGADTTARIWTIDSNANVAYPIGTAITFVNDTSGGVITIAITSDTLVLAGAGTTGSRTLAANGIATALKITSTRWIISGTGLT